MNRREERAFSHIVAQVLQARIEAEVFQDGFVDTGPFNCRCVIVPVINADVIELAPDEYTHLPDRKELPGPDEEPDRNDSG